MHVPPLHPSVSAETLDVLVVDDDQDARQSLESAVRQLGYSCAVARDGLEAWEMFQAHRPDIVLSDWKMPGLDGFQLCQKLQSEEDDSHPHAHFIFVTGLADKTHLIAGMRAGADGFLTKPVAFDELEAHLEAARRMVLLQKGLRDRNASLLRDSERFRIAARTDPLTTAFNRLALTEDLDALAARTSRYGHKYCAALCDIDNFKACNSRFGHLLGDEVLSGVAQVIRATLRRGDVFYRFGGDEFLVILPEQSLAQAALGMDRVRQEVERLRIAAPKELGELPSVTISVGIAALKGSPDGSIEDWLRRADAALYVAKERGRNRVEVERRESGTIARVAPAKVLIADDDADMRGALKGILTNEGYDVIEATDGVEALELLAGAADGSKPLPDVILLDFVMPGFSGLGILRAMRRFSRVPPTIIMTGFPDHSVESFAHNLGAVRVLRKPINADALSAALLECLGLSSEVSHG